MKKRGLLLTIVILFSVCLLVGGILIFNKIRNDSANEKKAIKKYEWVKLLCDEMQLIPNSSSQTTVSGSPVTEDINKQNDYSAYINMAKKCGIVDAAEVAEDESATGKFLAQTSIRSVSKIIFRESLGKDSPNYKNPTEEDCINVFVDKKIIGREELDEYIDSARAKKILEQFMSFYEEMLINGDMEEIDYKENVYELPAQAILDYAAGRTSINVDSQWVRKLKVGDMIVFPVNQERQKITRKITAINNTTLTIERAKAADVIDNAQIHGTMTTSLEDIAKFNNVELKPIEAQSNLQKCEKNMAKPAQNMSAVGGIFHGEKYKVSITAIQDEEGELDWGITMSNGVSQCVFDTPGKKVEGKESAVEITAEYEIEDIEMPVIADIVWSRDGVVPVLKPKMVVGALLMKQSLTSSIKGTTEVRKKLFSVPLLKGPLSGSIGFYLVVGLDGTLSIKTDISYGCIVSYREEVGYPTCRPIEIKRNDPEINAEIALKLGFEIEADVAFLDEDISIFGWKPDTIIFDIEADVGAEGRASTTLRNNGVCCLDLGASMPTLTVSAFADRDNLINDALKALMNKKITLEWDILDYDNAPFKFRKHFENWIETEACSCDDIEEVSKQSVIDTYKEFLKNWKPDNFKHSAHVVDSPIGPILITTVGTSSLGLESTIYKYADGKTVELLSKRESSFYFSKNRLVEVHRPNNQNYGPGNDELVATLYELDNDKYTKVDSQNVELSYGDQFRGDVDFEVLEEGVIYELLEKNSLSASDFVDEYNLKHLYCETFNEIGEVTEEYEEGCHVYE